jgi:hypothetical protein
MRLRIAQAAAARAHAMDPAPSAEQGQIIDFLSRGQSVVVHACAGSGKSTTTRLLCAAFPRLIFRQVVYNKRLQLETDACAPVNLTSDTLHSLADGSRDDEALAARVTQWDAGHESPSVDQCDVFVVDEAQDMSPLYIRALAHIGRAAAPTRVVVLGDTLQRIYTFDSLPVERRASDTLLRNPGSVFPGFTWAHGSLTTSYRLTPAMTELLNPLWGSRITAGGAARQPVRYFHGNPYGSELTSVLIDAIRRHGASNVMMLGPSIFSGGAAIIRQSNAVQRAFDREGVPVTYVTDGSNPEDAECFSVGTWHGAKGTERPCVVVFDFATSAPSPPDRNALCVACSRASCELILVHPDHRRGPLPYVPLADPDKSIYQLLGSMQGAGTLAPCGARLPAPSRCKPVEPFPRVVVVDALARAAPTGSFGLSRMDDIGIVTDWGGTDAPAPPLPPEGAEPPDPLRDAIVEMALRVATEMRLTGRVADIESHIYPVVPLNFHGTSTLAMVAMQAMRCRVRGAREALRPHWEAVARDVHGEEGGALNRTAVQRVLSRAKLRTSTGAPVAWGEVRRDDLMSGRVEKLRAWYRDKDTRDWAGFMYAASMLVALGGRHNHLVPVGSTPEDYEEIDVDTEELTARLEARCDLFVRTGADMDDALFDAPLEFTAAQPVASLGGGSIITGLSGRATCANLGSGALYVTAAHGECPDATRLRAAALGAMVALDLRRPCTVHVLGSDCLGTAACLTVTSFSASGMIRYALERARAAVR